MVLPSMLKEVLSLVFKRPVTVKYPFEKLKPPEDFRGKQIIDWEICTGCGLCRRDCPAFAIELVPYKNRKVPSIDLSKCVFCYQCADSCPRKAIKTSSIFELATWRKEELFIKPEEKKE